MKKNLILFLTAILILGFSKPSLGLEEEYVPPVNPPLTKYTAKLDDNQFLTIKGNIPVDFFVDHPQSENLPVNQRILNIALFPKLANTHLLFYGEPHSRPDETTKEGEYRYTGYNIVGENLPNLNWPNDVLPKNKYLDDNKWIPNPWNNDTILHWAENRRETLVHTPYLEPKPQWRKNIWWGLKLMHGTEFRGDEKVPWEQFVHVLQPPTFWGWGWGIAWHDEHDGRGILYRTIPIAPESVIVKWVPNLYIKDFNPGTPTEEDPQTGQTVYAAEPFTQYTATVTFGISAENEWIKKPPAGVPLFIGGAHQIDNRYHPANLSYRSGPGLIGPKISAYPWGAPAGYKYHTVTFNENKSEVTATFNWTAQPQSKSLSAGINRWPGFQYLYEGPTGLEYDDNYVSVPLTIKPLPDAFVVSLSPGADLTESGEEYEGTVIYGLGENFPGPVEVKLGLTHNSWPVSEVNGKLITLQPGEKRTFKFKWHGQKSGSDSLLEAKIWPQSPTLKDINWQNNTKKVSVLSNVTDVAVTDIDEKTVVAGSNELTKVFFNNLGQRAKTFDAHFFVNGQRKDTARVTILPGKPDYCYFNWQVPDTPGQTVRLKVIADPAYKLNDINRRNNVREESVEIVKSSLPDHYCAANQKNDAEWDVTYHWTTTNSEGKTVRHSRTVTYHESISATVTLNTKQGDPNAAPEERRGAWEIEPFARKHGISANRITRAGYGFEVLVTTDYYTDWETKCPPQASKKGGLPAPLNLQIEFWDTKGRSVFHGPIPLKLKRQWKEGLHTYAEWTLDTTTKTLSDGKKVTDAKHYTSLDNYSALDRDSNRVDLEKGKYYVSVTNRDNFGMDHGLEVCEESWVLLLGNMYDDIYTRPKGN